MIRIYRQNALRRKYPSSTWIIESPDRWIATIKNPLSRNWWHTWTGSVWGEYWQIGLKEGLTLIRVERFTPEIDWESYTPIDMERQ